MPRHDGLSPSDEDQGERTGEPGTAVLRRRGDAGRTLTDVRLSAAIPALPPKRPRWKRLMVIGTGLVAALVCGACDASQAPTVGGPISGYLARWRRKVTPAWAYARSFQGSPFRRSGPRATRQTWCIAFFEVPTGTSWLGYTRPSSRRAYVGKPRPTALGVVRLRSQRLGAAPQVAATALKCLERNVLNSAG